jgi:GT2 family glycosyltransferase/O-antigen/teichoic acid export membrane protein
VRADAVHEPAPPLAPVRSDRRRRLLEHIRTPLNRDAYALTINAGFTAVTGFVYWIVAANEYSARAVGINSALISSMMFLAGIAGLNLPNLLVRFLPNAGNRTARAVAASYAAAAVVGALAVVVFVVGIGFWAPRLHFLHANQGLLAWFFLSTLAWCVFTIQDSVLTALGRAVWVPAENAVFSLLKLLLLAAVVAVAPLYGIFVSWTIAMLISIVGVNALVFKRVLATRRSGAPTVKLRDRAFARYFAADYVCSISWVSAVNLMPVVVTAVAGATTNAYYALAWAVALPLYTVAANVGMSLVLHGAHDRDDLPALTRRAALHGARLLVPATVVVVLLAPVLLRLFGADYADRSATLLRLLAAGALPNLLIMLAVSVSRVERRMRVAVLALGGQAVLALGLVAPLLHAMGVTGVGVAWLISQCVVAAGVALTLLRRRDRAVAEPPGPVRVVQVELSEPLPVLAPETAGRAYSGAQVLVRRGAPLGIVNLTFEEDRAIEPVDLAREIERQLGDVVDRIPPQPAPPVAARPSVSVVIPTHARPQILSECLDSVLAGDLLPDEIVVVDNAPETPDTLDLLCQRYPGVDRIRRVPESRRGPVPARVAGLAAARCEIVAFIDDDVVVDSSWLSSVVDAFSAGDRVAAVTSLIIPFELETPAQLWLEQFGGYAKGFNRRIYDLVENRSSERLYPYSAGIYGSGASMAFRTDVVRELGGIDDRLSFGGEDLDLFLKVILAGHQLVYEPAAIVWHHHPAEYHRLRRTMFVYGAGLTGAMTKWAVSSPSIARDIVMRLPSALRLALDPRSRKNASKASDYPRELTRLERLGMLAGPFMFARWSWKVRRER